MNRYALHIGINRVNPAHYSSNFPILKGAVNDALSMQQLLKPLGYVQQIPLHDQKATATNVQQELKRFAGKLVAGDMLVITYSGHGSQVIDPQGIELDRLDEVFVFWDRMFIDDELRRLFAGFAHGIRIVVISDSCNSRTNIELAVTEEGDEPAKDNESGRANASSQAGSYVLPTEENVGQTRLISVQAAMEVINRNSTIYLPIMQQTPFPASALKATVLSLSACRDNQEAREMPGGQHGWFTFWLLDKMAKTGLPTNYSTLRSQLEALTATYGQNPQLKIDGPNNPPLENQQPFL